MKSNTGLWIAVFVLTAGQFVMAALETGIDKRQDAKIVQLQAEVQSLQDTVRQLDERSFFGEGDKTRVEQDVQDLEVWVSAVQAHCDQCILECGGPD